MRETLSKRPLMYVETLRQEFETTLTLEMEAFVTTNKSRQENPMVGPLTRCRKVDICSQVFLCYSVFLSSLTFSSSLFDSLISFVISFVISFAMLNFVQAIFLLIQFLACMCLLNSCVLRIRFLRRVTYVYFQVNGKLKEGQCMQSRVWGMSLVLKKTSRKIEEIEEKGRSKKGREKKRQHEGL